MRKIVFFLIYFNVLLYSNNNYCVQLMNIGSKNSLTFDKVQKILNYDKHLIVNKDKYDTLLIGSYSSFKSANIDKKKFEKYFKDAFIKRCSPLELQAIEKRDNINKKVIKPKIVKNFKKKDFQNKLYFKPFYYDYYPNNFIFKYLCIFGLSCRVFSNNYNLDKNQLNKISILKKELLENSDEYMDTLKEQNRYLGLSFSGGYEKFLTRMYNEKGYKYNLKLQWDIFNDGYYESQKNVDRTVNETELQYLQLLVRVSESDFNSKLQEIQRMNNYIRAEFFNSSLESYNRVYRKRVKQTNAGFNTIDDLYYLRKQIRNSKVLYDFYSSQASMDMNKSDFDLISKIESIDLIDKSKFIKIVFDSDYTLKINKNLLERVQYFPEYKDNIKLQIFLEREYGDSVNYIGTDSRDSYGFNFELPIFINTQRDKLMDLEKTSYDIEERVLKERIKEKVESLYYQVGFAKAYLEVAKNELNYLIDMKTTLSKKQDNFVRGFSSDPFRDYDLNSIFLQKQKFEILTQRLLIYRVLVELLYMSNSKNLKSILDLDRVN